MEFEKPQMVILTAETKEEVSYSPERADDRGYEGFCNCCYR